MLEQYFQSVHILVEIIGFGLIIFKGGNYIGKITQILENQHIELVDIKDRHIKHSNEDREEFKVINRELTELKVALASEVWKKK